MAKGCTFAKGDIMSILSVLDREYKSAYKVSTPKSNKLLKTYSKMAVIATGGWVEDGIKDLMEVSISKLTNIQTQAKLQQMAGNIHGFSYGGHFSRAVIITFGAHGLEFIESRVGASDISRLSSVLGNLKTLRDEAAHSHVAVIKWNPSDAITAVNVIFPILKEYERSAKLYCRDTF